MKIKHLVYLLFVLVGCDKQHQDPLPPHPALVMVVADKAESNSMSLVGEVRPRYESNQGFRINGKIIARKVDVGATVRKGQVLARLDPADTLLTISSAQADVRAAEASYALAMAEEARYRQLFTKKFISASALDVKTAELKSANARLTQVKAQANLAANQSQYTQLTADRDGVITFIQAEPGQVVQVGETIAKIADTQKTEILVAVPEARMNEVRLNSVVAIRLWANPEKIYSGFVREIAPAADSNTRTFNLRIAIQNADGAVKLGMTVSVKASPENESQDNRLLIPNTALTEINGKKIVWVIDAFDKAQPREVSTGQFSEEGILITNGLQEGEQIAIAGVHTLVKGQQIKPVLEVAP